MRIIDNFEVLMQHMDFVDPNDRYIVHIMRRPKDCKALTNTLGSNEAQRLIRTYYIDNREYLETKIPAIKELCKSCNARAYLIVQPKNNFDCLLNLGKKILETIQERNYSVKPEHLLRQAYCEHHKSRKKLWIVDLDREEMVERWIQKDNGEQKLWCREWTLKSVLEFIRESVSAIGRNPEDVYVVPTKNGWHIITPPFNLQEAQTRCRLLFEGRKKLPLKDEKTIIEYEERTGWLHKDGMTVLFHIVED